ncbi:unnamed protein product [Parajaminaea phylloscopi]
MQSTGGNVAPDVSLSSIASNATGVPSRTGTASNATVSLEGSSIAQKRSSSSIHGPPYLFSTSHRPHASVSNHYRATGHNPRDSSLSLSASESPSSFHGGFGGQHGSPLDSGASAQYSAGSPSTDTTQTLIASVVQRLVKNSPYNSGSKLAILEDDELVRASVSHLVTLSRFQLPTVLRELMSALEPLHKSVASFPEGEINISLLQSQLLILRIMTSCVVYHWRCCQEAAPPQEYPEGVPSKLLPLAWVDPDPLDDHLAKSVLSTMTVTLRQTVAREDRQIYAWAGLTSSASSASNATQSLPGRHGKGNSGGDFGTSSLPGLPRGSDRSMREWDQISSHGSAKAYRGRDEPSNMSRDEGSAGAGSNVGAHAAGSDTDGVPVSALSLVNGISLFVLPPGCPPALAPFEVPTPGDPDLGGPERPQRFKPLSVIGGAQESGGVTKSDDLSESLPALTKAVYRYANLVIFYLSSSNWPVVHARIRNRVAYLVTTPEDLPNAADLRIIECGNLNVHRLNDILHEYNNSFLSLRKGAQQSAAFILRRTVWTFIQYNPAAFSTLYATGGRLEGDTGKLFDAVYSLAETSRKRTALWPTLTALLILTADAVNRLKAGSEAKQGLNRALPGSVAKKGAFIDTLRKSLKSSKVSDIAAVCAMDICKAATYSPINGTGLRMLVPEFQQELRERVFDVNRPMLNSAKQIETSLIVEGFVIFYRLDAARTLQTLLPLCIADSSPSAYKIGFLKAVLQLVSESLHIPWNPPADLIFPHISLWMRRTFKELLHPLFRTEPRERSVGSLQNMSNSVLAATQLKGLRSSKGNRIEEDNQSRILLIQAILSVWKADTRVAAHGISFHHPTQLATLSYTGSVTDLESLTHGALQTDSTLSWAYMLGRAACVPGYPDINAAAVDVLQVFYRRTVPSIGPKPSNSVLGDTFLLHSRRAFHSCEALITQKMSEQLVIAADTVEQRHWYRLWERSIQFQSSNSIYYTSMPPEERSEIPRPSPLEKLIERVVLQVGFFLGICSADTEVVTLSLRTSWSIVSIRTEARKVGDAAKAPGDDWSKFWEKLTDLNGSNTGRVARQKRLRVLFREISYPTPASLIAWKEILRRWSILTPLVARPSEGTREKGEDTLAAQWDNYAGFLASSGGLCLGTPPPDAPALPEAMLDPAFALPEDIGSLIDGFIQEMVDLLVSDSVWMREKVKETLGLDLNARLAGSLLRQIHAVLGDFFDKKTGLPNPSDMFTIFVEQSIAVVHLVLNRLDETSAEWTSHVDVGSLMVLYVEYVNALGRREQAIRIKTSMCQLCQAFLDKKSLFAFRNELRVRNRLVQALSTWSSDLSPTDDGKNTQQRLDRLQKDLDIACLRIISTLLTNLPLILPDDALMLDDKVEWAKARQFSLYSSHFIKVLSRTRTFELPPSAASLAGATLSGGTNVLALRGSVTTMAGDRARNGQLIASAQKAREAALKELAPLREYAILALSNLLASNIDSGLQQSLILGYSEDPELRTAFMRIMTNVLSQGAAFDDLERLKKSQKQSRLVELIGDSDLSLALSICQVCRGLESESGVDKIMLSIFDSHGGILKFLKAAVEEEIEKTPSEEMVFRSNSFRTHLLSLFAKTHGYDYLRSIITPLITDMANRPAGYAYEIDPQKLDAGESAQVNQARLEETAQTFINTICDSAAQMPAVMRELCRHIRVVMDRQFPNSRYQGVGGFMFLRFISPAIVAPQLIDMSLPGPSKTLRRGLLLVSKILQTLASNNLFSAHKEPFMIGLNDFLRSNVWRVTTFLDGISDTRTDPDRLEAADQPLGYGIHPRGYGIADTEQQALHKWLYKNADKVGKELLTRSAVGSTDPLRVPNGVSAHAASSGKQIYEQLCVTLANMGAPPGEVRSTGELQASLTKPAAVLSGMDSKPQAATLQKTSRSGKEGSEALQNFFRRTGGRNLQDEMYDKIFYVGPPSKSGRPVVYYNPHLQDAETIDYEGLIAHVIRLLEQLRGAEYDMVIDTTAVKLSNLTPSQWTFYFGSVVAPSIASRLRTVIMLNANTLIKLALEEMRAMPSNALPANLSSLSPDLQIVHCNSFGEIDAHIERRNLALSPQTMNIMSAVAEHRFSFITMVWYYRQLIPVTFRIAGDHLQITCLKGQEFFPSNFANANDVFHLADVDDVRAVSIRGDDNAFLLTVRGGELTFIFNSRERLEIVQALREARARVSRIRPTKSLDRTLLPSDVPGTLLNMAMLNITSEHQTLRLSAYNLLCALSGSFNFGASSARKRLLSSQGLILPANTTIFVTELSQDFAAASPGVTLEFFVSFFEGFEAASVNQKTMCLQYMSPWLQNLVMFMHTGREQQVEYQKRIKEIFGNLLAITTKQPELFSAMQRNVWWHLRQLDDLIPLVLDVFCESAIDSGLYTPRFDAVIDTMVTFTSLNLRGKLLARLRRAIGKTAHNPTVAHLHENAAWKEIATLSRMNMVLSFTTSRLDALVYLPEVVHVVLLLVGNGANATRFAIRAALINLVHSLCTEDRQTEGGAGAPNNASSRRGDGAFGDASATSTARSPMAIPNKDALRRLLTTLASDDLAPLFGLPTGTEEDAVAFATSEDILPTPDNAAIAELARHVYDITDLAAPNTDTANSWRARLTSLVTSKAFQYNPIIQSRAFVLLGCLAHGEIDDDLLYQILVSLRGSITEWANLGNESLMISIVDCLGNVVKILPEYSRYLGQMFWLGVATVQTGHVQLFRAGVHLMQSVVTTLQDRGLAEAAGVDLVTLLTHARADISSAASNLDDEAGVEFEANFSFYMAALLVKGLRHPTTKECTAHLLRCLLEFTRKSVDGRDRSSSGRVDSEQLGFFVALLPTASRSEDFKELLGLAGVPPHACADAARILTESHTLKGTDELDPIIHTKRDSERQHDSGHGSESLFKYLDIVDNKMALLVVALISSLLSHAGSDSERLLYYVLLADASRETPAIVSILYGTLAPGLREIMVNSQSGRLLCAVQAIMQAATFEPVFAAQAAETARRGGPGAFLGEAGFSKLLDCGAFAGPLSDARRLVMAKFSTALLASLIEASAA